MSAAVVPFDYNGAEVRTLTRDGDPWFVLNDLCKVLEVGNSRMVSARLSEDAVSQADVIDSMGRKQTTTIVSEPGMYEVVIRSDKPQAAQFRWWLTHEVIPAIRKTGSYGQPALTDDEIVARALTISHARVQALEAKVAEDAPKVLFADAVATSHTSILVGELAKILRGNGIQVGQQRLYQRLREDGYLIRRKGSDWNMPTQRSMELGLFEVKETAITHSDGHVTVSRTSKVTGKGQGYFINRYMPDGTLDLAVA